MFADPRPNSAPSSAARRLRSLALGAAGALLLVFATGAGAQDEDCLACHEIEVADEGYGVDTAAWQASIHAELGLTCVDCHQGKEDFPHDPDAAPASCADCHDDAASDFDASIHRGNHGTGASPWPEGDPCSVCHGIHGVKAVDDPESRVHFRNVPQTCGACHGDLAIVQGQDLSTAPFDNYQKSVHGLARDDPDARPAVCTDCHRAHLVLRAGKPESWIHPFRISETCGKCHPAESEDYRSSVHGVAFEVRGVAAAPTCTNCHGIHTIKMVPEDEASPLEKRLVRTTCVTCHSSEILMSEYGVAPARVRTYQASYHGLAQKLGTTAVADCASCHGVHAIYPSTDPRSTVAPQNLEATCGHCHPRASEEFTKSPVHFVGGGATTDVVIVTWVQRIYWALIAVVIGGMLVHNAVILRHFLRQKARREQAQAGLRRFTTGQIVQHGILLVTFVVLAVTGFLLAYPDMAWSRLLAGLGLSESVRRLVHRGAAVILLATGLYHVVWIWATPYGRAELKRILPRPRDLSEIVQSLAYYLGRRESLPAAGKYDYPAKIEYWAVVWGTLVMGVTGLILWFPVLATSFLPFWAVKVSEVVHLLEAWLATLAILVFHFFFVFAHPDVYPLSLSMWNGRITEEEARHRHESWMEEQPKEMT